LKSNDKQMCRAAELICGWLSDVSRFSRHVIGRPLRGYQAEVAQSIAASILGRQGLTFAVMMSRQAGKNETSAQLEAYLLNLFQRVGGFVVKASPTFKPQTINSIMRLDTCLDNRWDRGRFHREKGYMTRLGNARCVFFSAQPGSNVVGATANILLECDEAQDVYEAKWNKDFRPMGASTNVTTVMWGTAWTSQTLLARTIRSLRRLEGTDGRKRVFLVPWERVANEVPAYGDYVASEIDRLGRNHPLVKTQYFLEEIDSEGGMFPLERQASMRGDHECLLAGVSGREYALLIDVAGEDEEVSDILALPPSGNLGRRDFTAVTVVDVDRSTCVDPVIGKPTYRVVHRYWWRGVKHATLYGKIVDLALNVWRVSAVVVDATGVGAGLASFLETALPGKVRPFVFTRSSKSDLGWSFLAVCDTGRFKDHADDGSVEYMQFWREVENATYEVLDGPGKVMRWGVWDVEIHDDLIVSASLCALLDDSPAPYVDSAVVEAPDVL